MGICVFGIQLELQFCPVFSGENVIPGENGLGTANNTGKLTTSAHADDSEVAELLSLLRQKYITCVLQRVTSVES